MINLGLIGAGRWGKRYIETLERLEGVRLAHLVSGNPESASLVPSDCKITPRWQDLLEDTRLDAIIIATPPETHFQMAVGAIRSGVPVLVEKPMTLSLLDAKNLVEEATDCGVLLMVGHTHLFSAAFREFKIKSKSLGKLKKIRSAGGSWGPFRPDTPPLWDWAPHDIAMSIDLLGSYPLHIEAKRTGIIQQLQATGEAVAIMLGFDSGICSEIHISNIQKHKQRVFEATFEDGTLTYDDLADNKLVIHRSPGSTPEVVAIDQSLPLTNLITEFCLTVKGGQKTHPSLRLGLQVVEVLTECQTCFNDRLAVCCSAVAQ